MRCCAQTRRNCSPVEVCFLTKSWCSAGTRFSFPTSTRGCRLPASCLRAFLNTQPNTVHPRVLCIYRTTGCLRSGRAPTTQCRSQQWRRSRPESCLERSRLVAQLFSSRRTLSASIRAPTSSCVEAFFWKARSDPWILMQPRGVIHARCQRISRRSRCREGNSINVDSLSDKVAIVTGASSGIGRAYVRALVEAGARVALIGRDRDRLESVAQHLSSETLTIAGDVSSAEFDRHAVDATMAHFGRIDVLLSNAGLYLSGDFADADLAAAEELLAVNVFGAISIVREALPHMRAAGTGDIIMTSSVSGHQAIHWEPVYSASKHAIQAFVHTVRRQLGGTGLRIGEIAPGVVLNELWGIDENSDTASRLTDATGIRSEDVADGVLFMLPRPRHVNIRDLVILPTSQEI